MLGTKRKTSSNFEKRDNLSLNSDDGEMRLQKRERDVVETIDLEERKAINELVEPDIGMSIKPQLSLKGHFGERADEEERSAIFEQPEESNTDRSPPGTVGQMHEIMSEYVGVKRQKYDKKAANLMHENESDTSKEAHRSHVSHISSCAMISPPIALVETTRSVQTFKMNYDRLFREFQEKLVAEYSAQRTSYMSEYQSNFNQNSSRRDDRINEMNAAIESQENHIRELRKLGEHQQSALNKYFTMKQNAHSCRIVWKAWLYYTQVQKRKNRIAAYSRNKLHRAKMRRLFESWRGVTHEWFKQRIDEDKQEYRQQLESQMLTTLSSRVDGLLTYMAQLEDNIKKEQDARERLTLVYDQSLNTGFEKLNQETRVLSQNPLVNEVIVDHCEDQL